MKITLLETGGFIGKARKAEISFDISEKDYKQLLKKISVKAAKKNRQVKDGFSYFLSREGDAKASPISISTIPGEYNSLFDELFAHLKTIK